MTLDTQFKINSNINYQRFIRENPIWYKILNRDPLQFKNFVSEVKDKYELKNSVCLDLFCGSGNLGIEAISNGSKLCYFVDNNIKAIRVVEDNLKNLNIKDNAKVLNFDYKKSLKYFNENNIKFDLIFVDPPYDFHVIEKIIKYVDELNLLNDNGLLILEFEKEKPEEKYNNLVLIKEKKYSWKYVYIYKKISN